MAIAEYVELSGLEKASVLLMALGPGRSAQVFRHLSEDEIERLSGEIVRMDRADSRLTDAVLAEFGRVCPSSRSFGTHGRNFAASALQQAVGGEKANELLERASRRGTNRPFAFLEDADAGAIVRLLAQEPAHIAAIVLKNLTPESAAEVLAHMSEAAQTEVALCIYNAEGTSPDVVDAIAGALQAKYALVGRHGRLPAGPEALVRILSRAGRATEKALLDALRRHSPSVGEQVRSMIFVFEDFARLSDKAIRKVLRQVEERDLCFALKGADETIKGRFLQNMAAHAAEDVKDYLETAGPVRVKDIEQAQQRIVGAARRLLAAGEIIMEDSGEELMD